MKRPVRLSRSFVERVTEGGRYGDGWGGHGLSLLVKPRARGGCAKSFSQRLILPQTGKRINIGLGSYPVVSLEEARAKALENRRAATQGKDIRRQDSKTPTFAEAVEKVIDLYRPSWQDGGKSEQQWRTSLERDAYPVMGRKRIDKVTSGDVMTVIEPIWSRKRVTAQRVRQRIERVMAWAIAQGYRENNPAADIKAILPKNGVKKEHYAALHHSEVAGALNTIRGADAYVSAKLALEFVVLTACRSGEARGATWDEIDLESRTWTIPASRMKAGVQHRIPLTTACVAVLNTAKETFGDNGFIFPSYRRKQLPDYYLSGLLRKAGIPCVTHGFRSTFRDWCAETGVSRELAESALAHVVQNQTEAAYFRTDLLDQRREVMVRWNEYVR